MPTPTPSGSAPAWKVPTDRGQRSGATGTVALDGSGTPVGYTVAPGDAESEICARLGVFWWQLTDDHDVYLGTNAYLTAGEHLRIVETDEGEALGAGAESDNPTCF